MFWLPRYYLTARINISKHVFLQPVNNAEETVRFTRLTRRLRGAISQRQGRLERCLFGARCGFGALAWLQTGTALAGGQKVLSANLAT